MRIAAAALGCAAGWLSAAPVAAQTAPDLNDLALEWSRGHYVSPVICEVEGEPVRAARRILVAPGRRHTRPPVHRIVLRDLEASAASRCFNEVGGAEPNVVGSVQIRLQGRPHPDTAQRDFATSLRRDGGFEFHVPAGRLRIAEVGRREDAEDPAARSSAQHLGEKLDEKVDEKAGEAPVAAARQERVVEFRGGSARFLRVAPGSDEARRLGDLRGLGYRVLELEAPDGTRLRFPLVMVDNR